MMPVGFNMGLQNIVLFAALFATCFAEIARISECEGVSENICKVSEVRITPCKKNANCVFKKGGDASLSFDFTPNFAATKLKTGAYWDNNAMEIPFAGLGSDDGCTYTPCPTQAGQQQTLNYNLHLSKKLPKGTFTFKWKLWNEEDDTQLCCFKTTVQIRN